MEATAPTERAPASGRPTSGSFAARARELAARVPPALAVVVALGVLLRLALDFSYRPAVFAFADSAAYVNMANDALFGDPSRTVGYSLFLEVTRFLSDRVEVTIQLQHLLGVATGLVLYATVRRLGAPVWVGVVAAAAVLLSLDQIYLEHTIASEGVFTFLLAGALYSSVRALEEPRPLRGPLTTRELWLVAAGLLLGGSAWVRGASAPLIPFFALWVALAIPGRWYWRLARAALAIAPAVAVLLVYFILNSATTGTFGLNQTGGWGIYARTAQFADCTKFTPPSGTETLCETIPSSERPGPDYYAWTEDSPARREFGYPPTEDALVGEFGWAAVKAQPVDYVRTVGNDFARFFFPRLNADRPFGGVGYELLDISHRDPPIEEDVRVVWVGNYFELPDPVKVTAFAGTLAEIQQIVRVHPLLLLQAALLGIIGFFLTRGRVRATIALLVGASILLLGVAASTTYNARYAIPVNGPLLAAGALGLWVLLERYRAAGRAAR